MKRVLDVYFEDKHYRVGVSPDMIAAGAEMFAKMDRDMDAGCRMGTEFVESPDALNRAQIVASRLLAALENEDAAMTHAMSAYILARLPGVSAVYIDATGQPLNTRFVMGEEHQL